MTAGAAHISPATSAILRIALPDSDESVSIARDFCFIIGWDDRFSNSSGRVTKNTLGYSHDKEEKLRLFLNRPKSRVLETTMYLYPD